MRGVYKRIRVAKAWMELASLKEDFLKFSIERSKAISYIRLAATANHSQAIEKRITRYQKMQSESLQKLEAEMSRLNLVVNQTVFGSKTSGLKDVGTFIQSQARQTNTHRTSTEEVL
ncbi:hypothetical protein HY045_03480 [Candidatus Woesebacteria bacterium]|nr:hypothetical protein [Candidatus Woesebacteria bacterium]